MKESDLNIILTQATEIVQWYHDTGSTSMAVHEISEQKDKLGGLYYFLSDLSCDLRTKYGDASVIHKITFNKKQEEFLNKQGRRNVSLAKSQAELETEDEIKAENEARNLAAKCDIMLKAIYINVENMRQRVSLLKQEQTFCTSEQYTKIIDRLSNLENKFSNLINNGEF